MIDIKNEMMNDFQTYGPQLRNLWEFYIDDWDNYGHISKLKVISTSLPFMGLEQEKRHTGHHHYSGYSTPDTFSVKFREDTNFSVMKYFENWRNSIFDSKRGVFRSGVSQTKTAYVSFFSFRFVPGALNSLKSQTLNQAESLLTRQSERAHMEIRNLPGDTKEEIQRKSFISNYIADYQKKVTEYGNRPEVQNVLEEVQTRSFTLYGIRFLSMSEISLDYAGGGQLELDVTFGIDLVEEGI